MPARGAGLAKRSVTIAGHPTSISLEPVFWGALRAAAGRKRHPGGVPLEEDAAVRPKGVRPCFGRPGAQCRAAPDAGYG